MFTMDVGMSAGSVSVETTEHRGFTPEEIAKRACEKIIQTTLHNMLSKQGHEDMADIIRRL